MKAWRATVLLIVSVTLGVLGVDGVAGPVPRRPSNEAELRQWLENMVVHHGYSDDEAAEVTGLTASEVAEARQRFEFPSAPPKREAASPLKVLPYPGGRHPRLGFFDGAVDPQRDTKLSIFPPWDGGGYVVVDVPEAIWSNLGLTYLAHTHIDTFWTKQGVALDPIEWNRRGDGSLASERQLPNGIVFGAVANPRPDHVELGWWVRNGSTASLSNLRAQVCTMLGRARGFEAQSADNKVLDAPFAAARDATGRRWVITAWQPVDRAWQNPPVPCLHSDPALPDCPPGESRMARGWIWFYEGSDLAGEIGRLRRAFLEK